MFRLRELKGKASSGCRASIGRLRVEAERTRDGDLIRFVAECARAADSVADDVAEVVNRDVVEGEQ